MPLRSPGLVDLVAESSHGADEVLAHIYVVPSEWVARATNGKQVTFAPVPPGRYVVRSWHPRLPGRAEPVDLMADRVSDTSITVGVNGLPKVP